MTAPRLRILVHDFSGHPFQAQLARALAGLGHDVVHVSCSSYATGKGDLSRRAGDPPTLRFRRIDLGGEFAKYRPARRLAQEIRYGRAFVRVAAQEAPDVVISSNVPLFAHAASQSGVQGNGAAFVFWHQDIYSFAIRDEFTARLPFVGRALGDGAVALERRLVGTADHVVVISDVFVDVLRQWQIADDRVTVIENWAPVDEIPVTEKDNDWARAHHLQDKTVLLYAGTLGLKHNPDMLAALAGHYRHRADVRVVVASGGPAAERLTATAKQQALDNLVVLPFQPFAVFPQMLATADVLLAILESDAGRYSVPSKVLTYHCAGRPIVAAMPADNPAAAIIVREDSGIVVAPDDVDGFVEAADRLVDDPQLRRWQGAAARRYADRAFAVDNIAERFEGVCYTARDRADLRRDGLASGRGAVGARSAPR